MTAGETVLIHGADADAWTIDGEVYPDADPLVARAITSASGW
ncbi:hypothetical protein [Natronosalvus caseinilyticus]|nr:hypothetical protein [Natronosalvus caseinilyticus]